MNPVDYMRSPFFTRQNWQFVANYTGEALAPFTVVRVGSPVLGNNNFGFPIYQPNALSTDFLAQYLVTGPFSIGSGTAAVGIASDLSCPGFVRINPAATPATGESWGAKHGQFTLEKYYPGFYMYGDYTTFLGTSIAVAKQIGVRQLLGKTDAPINKTSTGTVSIYVGAPGSESDTGMNVSATNKFADVDSDKWVWVSYNGAYPYLTAAECE